ncbi:MAG: thiamine-phosphate kinase [Acidobacteria bacterium]|nr:thiamine-phosphate kinase [Acidobacteriota bacterium]
MEGHLSDLGEFGLIRRIRRRVPLGEGVVLGPGDDAAALAVAPGRLVLATTDMLVEGVHFDLAFSAPADVGRKALAANASDIAAMGGTPRFALVALGAHGASPARTLDALLDGMVGAGEDLGVSIVGGDVVASDRLVLSVALLGEEGPAGVVRRSGARPGDAVCVTGGLGAAAAGLALLRGGADAEAARLSKAYPGLLAAHRLGRARVREGLAAAGAGVTAMIDCSDGLAPDVLHIGEESGVGIEIEEGALPLAPGVPVVARWLGEDPSALALGGGEDYELVLTVAPGRVEQLAAAVAPTPLTRIGWAVAGPSALLRSGGAREPLEGRGWDHFR